MTFSGQIKGGRIVLAGDPELPEGAGVVVEIVSNEETAGENGQQSLGDKLMKFAGRAVDLPADASKNHDHYLYGTTKR